MGEYRPQTRRSTTPPWIRRIQGSINDIRKELSALVEIRRDDRKVTNVKEPDYLRNTTLRRKKV